MIYTENYFQLWRIIADNKEEESEEMLAPGGPAGCLVYVIQKKSISFI